MVLVILSKRDITVYGLVILLKRDISVYGIGDFVKKGHHCIWYW